MLTPTLRPRPLLTSIASLLLLAPWSHAAEISAAAPNKTGLKGPERVPEPKVQAANDDPGKMEKKFKLPPGFASSLWAAEPLLANPVAFTIDEKGVAYVAETFRYRSSVLDIRHYMFMLEEDMAARTTDDRVEQIKRNFPNEWQKLGVETEVVRRVEDKDGDGKAETSSAYAEQMNTLLDGINSGVLAHDGQVWCTNMPNLWRFSGLKDGKAEKRESLSFGYGVRFSFTGHDMHGLALGPDGRLYFSFGDRGAYVKTKEGKTLAFSDEGAVFRCEPDGSHMEVYYHGLRNPQELAFDNHGNLFTGDNDCDQGDRERWVYLVEGGDSGWRVGWQHPPLGKERNMWLVEKLWEPRKENTPAYVLSPIMNIPDGPSGVVHNPGTGLPKEYDNAFFVCGFKGSSARSAISWWTVKPEGAGFLPEKSPASFIDNVQATDVDFGPDSKMYFTEWGEGWEGVGRGRIFRLENSEVEQAQSAQIADVKKLFSEGFKQRSSEELVKLLAHPDQRIRLNAQWALAAKPDAAKQFLAVAKSGVEGKEKALSRLHGIWGLGHAARLAGYQNAANQAPIVAPLAALLTDADAEVRAQVAKELGEAKVAAAFDGLVKALKDESSRVKFFATAALGKLENPKAVAPVLAMVRDNADKDEFLRHAGVRALLGSKDQAAIAAAAKDSSRSVRLAALLAMRREQKPEVAQFLTDADAYLVKEAGRAINDEGIAGAFGPLAQQLGRAGVDEPFTLRALNANFRVGTPAGATALAEFAAADQNPEALRLEALKLLSMWGKPAARDRVAGVFRPLGERDAAPAVKAVEASLTKLLGAHSPKIAAAVVETVAALKVTSASPALFGAMSRKDLPAKVRALALETLAEFNDPKLADAIKIAVTDPDASVRVEASAMLGKLDPEKAAEQLASAFASSAVPEKKLIITSLGTLKGKAADKALAGLLDEFIAGKIAPEVQLELLEAAALRKDQDVKAKLATYQANLPKGDLIAPFAVTLMGGDKANGEKVFNEHAVAQCLRCHKVSGTGGEAGPDLTGIGKKKDRRYLLEAIINPNAAIADGFQTAIVTMKNGDVQAGMVKAENDKELTLQVPVPNAPPIKLAKADIKQRDNAPSGMIPQLGELLTKREIRDVLEYMATLK